MKFIQWLQEGKITKDDRRELTKAINKEDTGKITLSDGSKVEIEEKNNTLIINYDKNNDNLTFTLTDICDTLGLDFNYEINHNKMQFTIEV